MRLGFDFDNTLISYDLLFHRVALDKGLIHKDLLKQKKAVRDYMRDMGAEDEWTRLQGEVYGGRILEAEPFIGMMPTIKVLAAKKIPMYIVSHKTKTPYLGEPWDLHSAARGWLKKHGFFNSDGLAWSKGQVFFELTMQEKIERIVSLGCTHYVDDLPEILEMLPRHIVKILFTPNQCIKIQDNWSYLSSWQDLPKILELE
jgi:hypothetical protein